LHSPSRRADVGISGANHELATRTLRCSQTIVDWAGRKVESRRWMDKLFVTLLTTFIAVLIPALLTIGAGLYSLGKQCNQDASDLETQLTSTLLEIAGREARIKALLAANADNRQNVIAELPLIESGADGHFGDPTFKEHSLVNLVNQYNRLLRRVKFPAGLKCDALKCDSNLTCDPKMACDPTILDIDTQVAHPEIESLNFTGKDTETYAHTIDGDLTEVARQQAWHKFYGPSRLCSLWTLVWGSEPWRLISLVNR
jgi:hypothetical protein